MLEPTEDAYRRGHVDARAKIVAWLRSYIHNNSAQGWAEAIEDYDDVHHGPCVYPEGMIDGSL